MKIFIKKAKIKRILQKANKYLLLLDITLINTILLFTFVNTGIVNSIIDKITVIY